MADLAIIIVSYNSARWLAPCLESVYAHAGGAKLDVIVVDNESTDGSAELVEREFPQARVLRRENRGFAYGNNQGLLAADAPFVLFLNADTEILEGTFAGLLQELRARPSVGLVGCRQLTPEGDVYPTIRRFPNAARLFFEALGSEHFPFRAAVARRARARSGRLRHARWSATGPPAPSCSRDAEAVLDAGLMDERFFMYCEEPDLCLRIRRAGWRVRHLPSVTILHHAGKAGWNPRFVAQDAYARRQYMQKHFAPVHRALALSAFALGHGIRAALGSPERRLSSRAALRTLAGLEPPPFGDRPVRPGSARSRSSRCRRDRSAPCSGSGHGSRSRTGAPRRRAGSGPPPASHRAPAVRCRGTR